MPVTLTKRQFSTASKNLKQILADDFIPRSLSDTQELVARMLGWDNLYTFQNSDKNLSPWDHELSPEHLETRLECQIQALKTQLCISSAHALRIACKASITNLPDKPNLDNFVPLKFSKVRSILLKPSQSKLLVKIKAVKRNFEKIKEAGYFKGWNENDFAQLRLLGLIEYSLSIVSSSFGEPVKNIEYCSLTELGREYFTWKNLIGVQETQWRNLSEWAVLDGWQRKEDYFEIFRCGKHLRISKNIYSFQIEQRFGEDWQRLDEIEGSCYQSNFWNAAPDQVAQAWHEESLVTQKICYSAFKERPFLTHLISAITCLIVRTRDNREFLPDTAAQWRMNMYQRYPIICSQLNALGVQNDLEFWTDSFKISQIPC